MQNDQPYQLDPLPLQPKLEFIQFANKKQHHRVQSVSYQQIQKRQEDQLQRFKDDQLLQNNDDMNNHLENRMFDSNILFQEEQIQKIMCMNLQDFNDDQLKTIEEETEKNQKLVQKSICMLKSQYHQTNNKYEEFDTSISEDIFDIISIKNFGIIENIVTDDSQYNVSQSQNKIGNILIDNTELKHSKYFIPKTNKLNTEDLYKLQQSQYVKRHKQVKMGHLQFLKNIFSYQKIYAQISYSDMKIFKDVSLNQLLFQFDFRYINCIAICKDQYSFQIRMIDDKDIYHFKTFNGEPAQEWFEIIQISINDQLSKKNIYLKPNIYKKHFFKNHFIDEIQLNKIAQTGDILLTQTNHIGAKIQRKLTQSQFDHVSLLIKLDGCDSLYVFESQQGQGVTLSEWYTYIRRCNLITKVEFRPLNKLLSKDQKIQLMEFIHQTCGKNYELNIKKLLSKKSIGDSPKKQNKKNGYFCSELVAACYKQIGLLDDKKSCSQYWPACFSQDKNISLKNNFCLNNQLAVILRKQFLQ